MQPTELRNGCLGENQRIPAPPVSRFLSTLATQYSHSDHSRQFNPSQSFEKQFSRISTTEKAGKARLTLRRLLVAILEADDNILQMNVDEKGERISKTIPHSDLTR